MDDVTGSSPPPSFLYERGGAASVRQAGQPEAGWTQLQPGHWVPDRLAERAGRELALALEVEQARQARDQAKDQAKAQTQALAPQLEVLRELEQAEAQAQDHLWGALDRQFQEFPESQPRRLARNQAEYRRKLQRLGGR